MTSIYRNYDRYEGVSDGQSIVNLIDNGCFMFYDQPLRVVEDLSVTRRGGDKNNRSSFPATQDSRVFDVLDPTFNAKTTYSSALLREVPNLSIGGWKIEGFGTVTINPKENGVVIPSFDGGNLLSINCPTSGVVTLSQEVEYFYPLLDSDVTIAFSGRKFFGPVSVEMKLLADDSTVVSIPTSAQFFGSYRRISKFGKMPKTADRVKVEIKLTGSGSWSVGLSGLSLALGSMDFLPPTPSLSDLLVPKGTVVIALGRDCPVGYIETGKNKMALLLAGQPRLIKKLKNSDGTITSVEVTESGGSDFHDHNPDGQLDGMEEPPTAEHVGPAVPAAGSNPIHGIGYRDTTYVFSSFPDDVPTVTLSKDHTHFLTSVMKDVPKNIEVRFCKKV